VPPHPTSISKTRRSRRSEDEVEGSQRLMRSPKYSQEGKNKNQARFYSLRLSTVETVEILINQSIETSRNEAEYDHQSVSNPRSTSQIKIHNQ
jgi:hypothetical protein